LRKCLRTLFRSTDPDGNVTLYDDDKADRLTNVTDPLLKVTTYGYDDAGNLRACLKSQLVAAASLP
jgi:YD repeat-containing protein